MPLSRPDRGDLLIAAQLLCAGGVFWPGRARWALPGPVRVGALGAVVGGQFLALAGSLRLGKELRPHPRPSPHAVLRTDGVYARVRHPIYAGLMLGAGGVAVLRARPEPVLAVVLLAAILRVKAGYEDRLLRERFGAAYDAYAAQVPRFVPRPRALRHHPGPVSWPVG